MFFYKFYSVNHEFLYLSLLEWLIAYCFTITSLEYQNVHRSKIVIGSFSYTWPPDLQQNSKYAKLFSVPEKSALLFRVIIHIIPKSKLNGHFRWLIIEKILEGVPYKRIAEQLNISKPSVSRIFSHFKNMGVWIYHH